VYDVPSIGHQRGQHLLWYEAPAFGTDCMRKHRGRGHSPRPLCACGNVWIDGSCVAHVVDAPAEEGLHWGSEVEGDHAGCHRSHTRCLYSGRWGLVGGLSAIGSAVAAAARAIAVGRDSSAGTGAGRHRITWECSASAVATTGAEGAGSVCGAAARGEVTRGTRWFPTRNHSQAAVQDTEL
jgi:hypothetical protein